MFSTFSTILLFVFVCKVASFTPPDGVCQFNLPTYTGGWYQLATSANIINTTQMDCICSTAYYTLNSTNANVLDLTNSCINSTNEQFTSVTGNVYPANEGEPSGNLHVIITGQPSLPSAPSNYIIMRFWKDDGEDGNLRYALIGGNDENSWWLLSRSPNWNQTVWNQAQNMLRSYDYNTTDYQQTDQSCIFLGTHGRNLLPPGSS